MLQQAAGRNASDILLVAGAPVMIRVTGNLAPLPGGPMDSEDIRSLVLPLLETHQAEELHRNKTVDFGFFRESVGRFRVNVHYQRGTLAASIRLLPAKIPTLESLHLPAHAGGLADRRQGLVLVTGPTGCGKTSTLAALIDIVNSRRAATSSPSKTRWSISTPNRSAIIEQIEVGRDTPDFAVTLRSIMRQSPDVILVGEMRDPETMATALTAAETGHLVLSTLHTNDTVQAVSRILDSFPPGNQPQIRQQLSLALRGRGRAATGARGRRRRPLSGDRDHDRYRRDAQPDPQGDDHQLRSQISMGKAEGMMTMEQSLAELVRAGRIDRDTAFAHCFRSDDLQRYLA